MAIKSLDNETALLAKIAAGDQYAFSEVFNHYHNHVYHFIFRLLQDDVYAQEIVQETMLHVWQLGEKLKDIGNFEAYLKTVSKRRAIAIFRHNMVRAKAEKLMINEYGSGSNETEESVLLRETRKILEEGIALLPKQQREVYRLCREQGFSYEQAAEKLAISKGTVHSHMKLALKFLREHIDKSTYIPAIVVILKLF